MSGMGFAIHTTIMRRLDSLPRGLNDCPMTLLLKLAKDLYATVISIYALPMPNPDDAKEICYEQLNDTILCVHCKDMLIILGDFNARVGKNHIT